MGGRIIAALNFGPLLDEPTARFLRTAALFCDLPGACHTGDRTLADRESRRRRGDDERRRCTDLEELRPSAGGFGRAAVARLWAGVTPDLWDQHDRVERSQQLKL